MRYRREDVVGRAVEVLDELGLADLTMRRLGAELGVRPSALYHHFANKQTLLAAVADEIVRRGRRGPTGPTGPTGEWDEQVTAICSGLRDALLAYRDGAEVVATVWSFGLGAQQPYDDLVTALGEAGLGDLAPVAARTLLHFVYGHAVDEQTHLQAASVGAIDDLREPSDFVTGLGLVIAGISLARAVREGSS